MENIYEKLGHSFAQEIFGYVCYFNVFGCAWNIG